MHKPRRLWISKHIPWENYSFVSKGKKKQAVTSKGNKKQILEALKKGRDPKYEEIADITIDQNGQKNRKAIIDEIIDKLSSE